METRSIEVGKKGLDVAGAALRVGYDDASYFTHDYRRFFGQPPRQHIARLREEFQAAPSSGAPGP